MTEIERNTGTFFRISGDIGNLYRSYNLETDRGPVSVRFLHTPNFAAFWPKPKNLRNRKKKRVLGQCAGVMQTVLYLTPPPTDVRLLSKTEKNIDFVQNRKKPREIEKNKNQRFWDNVLVSCKQSVGQIVFGFFDFSRVLSVFGKIFRFLDVF